jgi:hypothetical protein
MMQGTRELILMDPSQPLDAVLDVSDPTVVSVDPGGNSFDVSATGTKMLAGIHLNAVRAGTTELRVKSGAGAVIDRIDLAVEVPARVTLEWGTPDGGLRGTGNATVKVGAYVTFGAGAHRADGTPLEATTGWTFSGDTPSVARVDDECQFVCLAGDTAFRVTGIAPGTARTSASGAGIAATATVDVTP